MTGHDLRQAREALRATQEELAEAMGLSQGRVSQLEASAVLSATDEKRAAAGLRELARQGIRERLQLITGNTYLQRGARN